MKIRDVPVVSERCVRSCSVTLTLTAFGWAPNIDNSCLLFICFRQRISHLLYHYIHSYACGCRLPACCVLNVWCVCVCVRKKNEQHNIERSAIFQKCTAWVEQPIGACGSISSFYCTFFVPIFCVCACVSLSFSYSMVIWCFGCLSRHKRGSWSVVVILAFPTQNMEWYALQNIWLHSSLSVFGSWYLWAKLAGDGEDAHLLYSSCITSYSDRFISCASRIDL